jgi:hypothetical protein
MAFEVRLGFINEHVLREFTGKFLPKLPGCRTVAEETPAAEQEAEGETDEANPFTHWVRLSISSPTAARDLCHQLTALLSHLKQTGLILEWTGGDGTPQTAQLSGQASRDAEIVAMRLSTSVKAHNDAEKAAKEG